MNIKRILTNLFLGLFSASCFAVSCPNCTHESFTAHPCNDFLNRTNVRYVKVDSFFDSRDDMFVTLHGESYRVEEVTLIDGAYYASIWTCPKCYKERNPFYPTDPNGCKCVY